MNQKQLICIGCPLGCSLTVTLESESVIAVNGNTCPKGDTYARKEITNPTRIVTSSVQVEKGTYPVVSCKTEGDIPKDKIFDVIEELKHVRVQAPISIGDVLLHNVANTGVDIIATKHVSKDS